MIHLTYPNLTYLHLGGELRAALELELSDHEPLHVVRCGALVQQPLGQLG